MFDFCYVANVLLLVHIWVFPHSAFLHKVSCCSAHSSSDVLNVSRQCFSFCQIFPVMSIGSVIIVRLHMLEGLQSCASSQGGSFAVTSSASLALLQVP